MTTTSELDLKSLEKKTVIFTIAGADGSTSKVEGVVEAASAIGVAYKRKGRGQLEMLEADQIVGHEVLPDKPKVIKSKKLKPPTLEGVRQHLADRHGINIDWLNADEVTAEKAAEYHDSINHTEEGKVLGHHHGDGESDSGDDDGELEKALEGDDKSDSTDAED